MSLFQDLVKGFEQHVGLGVRERQGRTDLQHVDVAPGRPDQNTCAAQVIDRTRSELMAVHMDPQEKASTSNLTDRRMPPGADYTRTRTRLIQDEYASIQPLVRNVFAYDPAIYADPRITLTPFIGTDVAATERFPCAVCTK